MGREGKGREERGRKGQRGGKKEGRGEGRGRSPWCPQPLTLSAAYMLMPITKSQGTR